MPFCNYCYSYIDGLTWSNVQDAFVCPICRVIIADNPSELVEWMESQDEEI